MTTVRTQPVAPSAAMLVESMRDIGYDLESALADVIDNSITAGARTVRLLAGEVDGRYRLGILDDGCGMSEDELMHAMRIGSASPLVERAEDDLGRFGLGLKTASFSQCRKLVVVTRKGGITSAAAWDLDFIAEHDDWLLQIPEFLNDIPWASEMGSTGTLVLWDKLDRLLGDDDGVRSAPAAEHVIERLDDARTHLELVFHRFLAGQRSARKVAITLNGNALEPFDPFHPRHPATQWGQTERIRVGKAVVELQPCTLPHFSKVTTAEWDRYAGVGGYLKNQGFYLYRANRLIIHGTWFGLARQTPLTQLARVRLDIPNGLDAEWKIDVKKAHAQPPYQVRAKLKRLTEALSAPARRTFTGKAATLATEGELPVWQRVKAKGAISYVINVEHPVVRSLERCLPADSQSDLRRLLNLIAAALPLQALMVDLGTTPQEVSTPQLSDADLRLALNETVIPLRAAGIETADIERLVREIEPFRSNWDRVSPVLSSMTGDPDRG